MKEVVYVWETCAQVSFYMTNSDPE
jgi:hypothetical protein